MAFFRHMGKKRTEYTMSICVHSGDHVTHGTSGKALKNGQPVSVQCKRGNKIYSTRMAVIEHSSVHWDEVLTFPITVYGKEESSKMTWDKKIYQFMIRTDGKSDTRLSTRIDLAEYIHTTSTHPITKFFALSEGDDSSSSSSSSSSSTSTPQKRTDSSQHMSSPSTSTSTSSIPMSPNTASTSSTPVLKLTIRATLASKAHSSPAMSSPSPTTSIPSLTTQASSPQLQTHSMNTFTTCDEENGTEHSHSSMNIPISPKHDEMISPKKRGNEIPIPSTPITTSTSTSTTISTSAPPKTTTTSSTLSLPSSKPHQLHHPRNSNEIIDGRETRSVSEAFDRVMIKPTSSTDPPTSTLTVKPTSDITRHDIESFEALVLSDQKERLSVPKNNMTRNRDPSMDFSSILGDEARMNRFSMALDDHIRQPRSHHSPQSHSPSSPSITISTDAAPSTTSSSHASSALSSPTLSLSASSSSSSHLDSHDDIRSISISTSHTPLSSTASTPANHDHAATARDVTTTRRSVLIPGSSGTLPLIKRGKDKRRGFSRFIGPNGTTHDFLEAEEDNRTRGDTKFQIHHTM